MTRPSSPEPAAPTAIPLTRQQLRHKLTNLRDVYSMGGCLVEGAKLVSMILGDLEAHWLGEDGVELSLSQAEEYSGYDERTLRRYIDEGVLPARRPGKAFLIKRGDLPRKPGTHGPKIVPIKGYDPAADAQKVSHLRHGKASESHGETRTD